MCVSTFFSLSLSVSVPLFICHQFAVSFKCHFRCSNWWTAGHLNANRVDSVSVNVQFLYVNKSLTMPSRIWWARRERWVCGFVYFISHNTLIDKHKKRINMYRKFGIHLKLSSHWILNAWQISYTPRIWPALNSLRNSCGRLIDSKWILFCDEKFIFTNIFLNKMSILF